MAYMNTLSAMNVASEDTKRIMRDGVRNASIKCRTEAAEGCVLEGPELFSDIDGT